MKFNWYSFVCAMLLLSALPAGATVQTSTTTTVQTPKLSLKDRILLKVARLTQSPIPSIIGCAKIVLKDGDVIEANIIQLTPVEVKYKRCGKPNDPETILYKKDILSIKADDGEIIYRNTGNSPNKPVSPTTYSDEKTFEGYSIAALITGIAGVILSASWLGLACAIVGIVFGVMGLRRINANPDAYKGKNMARAGLILGIIGCAAYVILLL
jgi:hypothetical protein